MKKIISLNAFKVFIYYSSLFYITIFFCFSSVSFAATNVSKSHGDFFTGNKLKDAFDDKNSFGEVLAGGYVAAIYDVLSVTNINGFKACIPNSVTLGQLEDVTKKFLSDHPEKLHYGASGLVASALYEAFPCK